ncbi:MAG TPA: helix-turn-helix domain-containing protein [Hymenobacter sp.]|jgi:excisionase family DNA binding protein
MLRLITTNGRLEIENEELEMRLLERQLAEQVAADAEQRALSMVYRIDGEPDTTRPYGGLLTQRLDISARTAYQLITDGKLAFTCAGKKNYRISERAVREFLGDMRKAS